MKLSGIDAQTFLEGIELKPNGYLGDVGMAMRDAGVTSLELPAVPKTELLVHKKGREYDISITRDTWMVSITTRNIKPFLKFPAVAMTVIDNGQKMMTALGDDHFISLKAVVNKDRCFKGIVIAPDHAGNIVQIPAIENIA